MTDQQQQLKTCPYCGLPGREAMIPDSPQQGAIMPRVKRGMRWECGTTEDVQSRMCATIEERMEQAVAVERSSIAFFLRQRSDSCCHAGDNFADDIDAGEHHARTA